MTMLLHAFNYNVTKIHVLINFHQTVNVKSDSILTRVAHSCRSYIHALSKGLAGDWSGVLDRKWPQEGNARKRKPMSTGSVASFTYEHSRQLNVVHNPVPYCFRARRASNGQKGECW
jgi:hypothetical protein